MRATVLALSLLCLVSCTCSTPKGVAMAGPDSWKGVRLDSDAELINLVGRAQSLDQIACDMNSLALLEELEAICLRAKEIQFRIGAWYDGRNAIFAGRAYMTLPSRRLGEPVAFVPVDAGYFYEELRRALPELRGECDALASELVAQLEVLAIAEGDQLPDQSASRNR